MGIGASGILKEIQKTHGMTLIIITHEDEIANSAPRHIRIRDGKVAS
jgi:ABC-type lipoprotein export system ATPase subunit